MDTGIIYIGIIFGIFLASFLVMLIICYKVNNRVFGKRYDYGKLKYYDTQDYPSLQVEKISFASSKKKYQLKGFIYSSSENDNAKGLIIVLHGLSAGHRQLEEEINHFVKNGCKVFSFDFLGCGESEGKNVRGFSQGILDFREAMKYIDSREDLKNLKKGVFSFSMGSFVAMNCVNDYPEIRCLVAMSPFDTSYGQVAQELVAKYHGNPKTYTKLFKIIEFFKFGKLSKSCSGQNLVDSSIPMIIIAGELDNVVNPTENFEMFRRCAEGDETKKFILQKDRYVKPDLSYDASKYDNETNEEYFKLYVENKGKIPDSLKDEFYNGLDYRRLNVLDGKLMEEIDTFIADNIIK